MYQYRMAKAVDLKRIVEIEMRSDSQSNQSCLERRQSDFDTRYQWWSDYIDRANLTNRVGIHRATYVAMVKLNIVGYIAGHLTSQPDPQGEIQSMNILKPQWGKGVEENLLRILAKWFKNRGVASVCVNVTECNPYREFFTRHGATAINDSLYRWDDIGKVINAS